jgi:hypothetical protein
MRTLREIIQSIISDDALYRRKDIPGDVDDPPGADCGCKETCSCNDEHLTPKYALYNLIGDAIRIYDAMEGDETGIPDLDKEIIEIGKSIKRMSR